MLRFPRRPASFVQTLECTSNATHLTTPTSLCLYSLQTTIAATTCCTDIEIEFERARARARVSLVHQFLSLITNALLSMLLAQFNRILLTALLLTISKKYLLNQLVLSRQFVPFRCSADFIFSCNTYNHLNFPHS